MFKRFSPVLMFFAAAASVSAQSLTEKIDVSLVNVDLTVTSHGAPARGLTSADFEVLEDGVPQKVTNFFAIENARDKAPAASTPSARTAEAAPYPGDERFRRRVLVIVDNRHITRHDRDVALGKLEQFMNQYFQEGAYDWSLAMITDRAHMLVPLTSDKTRIHDALVGVRQAMAGRPVGKLPLIDDSIARSSSNPFDEENIHWSGATIAHADPAMNAAALNSMVENSNRFLEAGDVFATYDAITQLTRSFAALPGRKIVLVLTEGFGDERNPLASGGSYDAGLLARALTAVRQRLVHDANASDASIYVIGTAGLKPINVGADTSSAAGYNATFGSGSSVTGGSIYWLAHETGGQVFTGNHIDESLRDFNESSSNFYSLAYHPPHGEDGKYHRISVRITRPGRYMLSYRNGYASLPVGAQLQRAMASPAAAEMQRSTIPVTITAGTMTATKDGAAVPISIKVPAKNLQFISSGKDSTALVDIFISVFNEDGRLITNFSTAREAHADTGTESAGDFLEHESIRLRRNAAYKVVVAVHDQTTDAVGITSTILNE